MRNLPEDGLAAVDQEPVTGVAVPLAKGVAAVERLLAGDEDNDEELNISATDR